ncbi:hypothetical protein A2U01_0068982, partial [Trifolium medium]|nr:hypothetical protein [Trifolium medium]
TQDHPLPRSLLRIAQPTHPHGGALPNRHVPHHGPTGTPPRHRHPQKDMYPLLEHSLIPPLSSPQPEYRPPELTQPC